MITGAHNERREGEGRGKEREAPTHSIDNSKPTHAAHVTNNKADAVRGITACSLVYFAILIMKDMAEKLVPRQVHHPALKNAPVS